MICRHTISERDLLVIPDLLEYARTCSHSLALSEQPLRFYACVVVEGVDGATLGTLCMMDHGPRPGGLTDDQAETVGRSLEVFFTPDDRAARIADREVAGAKANGPAVDDQCHLRRNGARLWASVEMRPLRDALRLGLAAPQQSSELRPGVAIPIMVTISCYMRCWDLEWLHVPRKEHLGSEATDNRSLRSRCY